MRVCTTVTMELLSDAIFGNGCSIPGGEDISVKTDEDGLPYLSGSTWKGLLREETANLLEWQGTPDSAATLAQLFGQTEAWHGVDSPRQIFLTPLTLVEPAEAWRENRAFTSVDPNTGTVESGSLRIAACIRRGLTFAGTITCQEQDSALLRDALRCIKYVGTSRTRGFGRVRVTVGEWTPVQEAETEPIPGAGDNLTYRLCLKEPLRVTDRAASHDTFLGCLGYLPASAVRGYVIHRLAKQSPEWFAANKKQLLRQVRFTDAVPCKKGLAKEAVILPALKGFYEDKLEQKFYSILHTKDVEEGTKRAKLGSFCTISPAEHPSDGWEIQGWSAKTRVETRIDREQKKMFQTEQLSPDQIFTGAVQLDGCSEEMKGRVAAALAGEIRLGAGIHGGTGLCEVQERRWMEEAPESAAYGYRMGDEPSHTLYLLLLSPLALVDEYGLPCGADSAVFQRLLGVPVEEVFCSTSILQMNGFNSTFGTRLPAMPAYDRGSMFRLDCKEAPALETLKKLERSGLGLRREEGLGRVLFLRDFERVTQKKKRNSALQSRPGSAAELRNRRAGWLLTTSMPSGLSLSQMGKLQAQWEGLHEAPSLQAVREAMEQWFADVEDKSPKFREDYGKMHHFILGLLQDSAQLPLKDAQSVSERLKLLSDLMDLNRKEA